MMATMIKRISILLASLLYAGFTLSAQEKDFGIWYELDAEKKITKRLDLMLSGSVRTFENASKIDYIFLEAALQYEFSDYFSGSASYRLSSALEDDGEYYYRHRLTLDAIVKYPAGNFTFSGRFRIQRATKTYVEDSEDIAAAWAGRIRFKTEYDFSSKPFSPYFFIEAYNPLFENEGLDINRMRLSGGTELRISNSTAFDIGYIFQRDFKSEYEDKHILSIALKVSF